MGDFVVRVHAVGGHGCQRDKGHGEKVEGCGEPGCPDCITRDYVRRLQAAGNSVQVASLTHWPAELPGRDPLGEVRDDLLSGVRRGSFR